MNIFAFFFQFEVSKTTGTGGTTDGSKAGSDFAEHRNRDKGEVTDDGFSEIEKLMKGKTFSRWLVYNYTFSLFLVNCNDLSVSAKIKFCQEHYL